MTRETSLLLAAAQLLGPSVGGSDENFERIARQAVQRALRLSELVGAARMLGETDEYFASANQFLARLESAYRDAKKIEPTAAQNGGAL